MAQANDAQQEKDPQRAIFCLEEVLKHKPLSEASNLSLMRVLDSIGEVEQAMDVYLTYRDDLRQKKSRPPSAPLNDLFSQLKSKSRLSSPPFTSDNNYIEPPGGAMKPGSPFYIKRETDYEFDDAIASSETMIVHVKAPPQTGKSSLMYRGLASAREGGTQTVVTDLQKLGDGDMETVFTFYLAIALSIAQKLSRKPPTLEALSAGTSPGLSFEDYLLSEILAKANTPFVWAIDGVERLFSAPYGDEVLGLLRSWHNMRADDPDGPWGRLTLVIASSTEPHLYVKNLNQSPFNVGKRIRLADFSIEQVSELNWKYDCPLRAKGDVESLYSMVRGHPYLVRLALFKMVTDHVTLDAIKSQSQSDVGIFSDHLQRLHGSLAGAPDLVVALRCLLSGGSCPGGKVFFRLHAAGVLRGDKPETAQLRCGLYEDYLRMAFP